MQTFDDLLHKLEIDSFKIRIPIDKVKIIDNELNQTLQLVNINTGEEIGDEYQQTKKYIDDDRKIKITFQIENIRDSNQQHQYLTIKCTSKLLRKNYFQGITNSNVRDVYNTIQSFEVVTFSYDDFLSSYVTDIDYKLDFRANEIEYSELVKLIYLTAKSSIYQTKGIRVFNKKDNKGFQFSDRKTATPNNPYLKVYNKEIEMNTKSEDFKDMYIDDWIDLTNLHRIEYTLKDRKHFAKHNINDNTLADLLNLTKEQKEMILNNIWDMQVNNIKPMIVKDDDLDRFTSKDIHKKYITMLMEFGATKDYILKRFIYDIDSRTTISRHKKMILDCFNEIDRTNPNIVNSGADKILSKIGIKTYL